MIVTVSQFLNFLLKQMAIAVFLCLIHFAAFTQNNAENFFFIQLTDPQFGMFEKNAGFEKETVLFKKAVAGINRLQPDFVVITGDFVHDQNSEEQINEFKRLTATISSEIPVYYSPGNHDVGKMPDKQTLKKYKKNYGKDKFAFGHKNTMFIGFNSNLIKGQLEKKVRKQFDWLQKQLKKGQDFEQIVIFCHHPFFIKNIDEPTAYANIDLEVRKKYLDLFDKNNVKVVFTGHHHNNLLHTYGNVELVTTSAVGKPLGKAPSGMRIIKVNDENIEHKYFGFDELPDNLESFE